MFDRLKHLILRRPSSSRSRQPEGGFMAGVLPGLYQSPPERTTDGLLRAATTMPWLYAAAWKAADACAAQPWQTFVVRNQGKVVSSRTLRQAPYKDRKEIMLRLKAAGQLNELENHPILDFLEAGNPYFPGRQTRALSQVYLDVVGEAFWIYERNQYGMPLRGWPLPPPWIINLPGPEQPFYRVGFRGWQGEIPQSEILRFVRPNPVYPYGRGSGIARSLGDELETYEYASKHTKQVFFNQARPDLVISGKDLGKDSTERLEAKWTQKLQGFWNVAKPFFISADVNVTPVSQNFQHLELVKLREHERDMIIQTFGYPPELFGINQHSNRSTINEASYIAARYVILPRLETQREFLQAYLVPQFDERIILDFVSPVEEDREFQLKVVVAVPAAFSMNEVRALAKHEPMEGKEGEYRVTQNTQTILETLKPTPEPKPATQPGQPAPKALPGNLSALVGRIVKEELAAVRSQREAA